MLERKRAAKGYRAAPGDEELGLEDELELDEGSSSQETGIVSAEPAKPAVDEELDNWDENVEDDWDEPDPVKGHEETNGDVKGHVDDVGMGKKRDD